MPSQLGRRPYIYVLSNIVQTNPSIKKNLFKLTVNGFDVSDFQSFHHQKCPYTFVDTQISTAYWLTESCSATFETCRNSKYFTRCQKSCETAFRKTKSHLLWHVTEFGEGVGEDSSCPSCRIMFLACRILKSHPVWHVAYKNYLVWHVAEFGEGVGEHYPPTNLKERSTLITKLSTKEKYLYTNENLLHRHVLFHPIVNFL